MRGAREKIHHVPAVSLSKRWAMNTLRLSGIVLLDWVFMMTVAPRSSAGTTDCLCVSLLACGDDCRLHGMEIDAILVSSEESRWQNA